jgi:RimJ/RimL family protein N-acetyltransferase
MPMSSAHLIYRTPAVGDLDRLFAIYSDTQTQLFNPSGPMTDKAQAAALLEGWIEHWRTHGYGWWAIARKELPEHVIGFGGIGWHDFLGVQRVNLGYRFAVEAWGQGFATETGKAALNFGFSNVQLGDVYAYVRPTHTASIRVLEKIGMQRCGEMDDVPGQAPSLMFKAVAGGAS